MTDLEKQDLERAVLAAIKPESSRKTSREIFERLRDGLERGAVRSAEKSPEGKWTVNIWVKEGLLLGFRLGILTDKSVAGFPFYDKDTYPVQDPGLDGGVRLVPGGSAIRSGAYVAPSVICMPPMYINTGAWVDEGTLVDSHALVGTCAQIGKNVHLSAAAQIGGVIEPIGAMPVIVEDDVFIGGNCGIYDGWIIRTEAVLAAGVVLTRSSRPYDLVNEVRIDPDQDGCLEIPEGAVVVPGSRPAGGTFAKLHGISLYTPVIVKYRDAKTDASTALENAIR